MIFINEIILIYGIAFLFMAFFAFDVVGFIQSNNLWPYVCLFLVVLFFIVFKRVSKKKKLYEAASLEMQAKNPWKPYFGQPVDAANVNIELKNGKILWRVPASKLEELAEDVKEWMPIPPRL